MHNLWVPLLPVSVPFRVLWFLLGFGGMCVGISLGNCCKTPINPGDLFPRELSAGFSIPYARVKVFFDLGCILVTAVLTLLARGRILGLGIGTIVAALTMGKAVGALTDRIRERATFVSIFERDPQGSI